MGAAAELDRPAERVAAMLARLLAHRDHADLVAIFLAEQRAGAGLAGVVNAHQAGRDLVVFEHDIIGDVFDPRQLLRRDRLGMYEVEAQTVGRDQRPALCDVIAEHLPQRFVQEMRRGMMRADRRPPRMIDIELERRAELERALLQRALMHPEIAGLLLRLGYAEFHTVT